MLDEPQNRDDDWDLDDFIEACRTTFLVPLRREEVLRCETIGEFESLIYNQLQSLSLALHNHEQVSGRVLGSINNALDGLIDTPIAPEEVGQSVSEIAREHAKKRWSEVYWSISNSLCEQLPPTRLVWWARIVVVLWIALTIGFGAWVGFIGGFILGGAALFCGFIALVSLMGMLPEYVRGPEISLREGMDRHIARIEKNRKFLSLPEVQCQVRFTYASWSGAKDAELIDGNTQFP